MPRFSITARVSVQVEIDIDAENKDQAQKILKNNIGMAVNMDWVDKNTFAIYDECIMDIDIEDIEQQ